MAVRIPIVADPSAVTQAFQQIQEAMRRAGQEGARLADLDLSHPELKGLADDLRRVGTQFDDLQRLQRGATSATLATMARNAAPPAAPAPRTTPTPAPPLDVMDWWRNRQAEIPNAAARARHTAVVGSYVLRDTRFGTGPALPEPFEPPQAGPSAAPPAAPPPPATPAPPGAAAPAGTPLPPGAVPPPPAPPEAAAPPAATPPLPGAAMPPPAGTPAPNGPAEPREGTTQTAAPAPPPTVAPSQPTQPVTGAAGGAVGGGIAWLLAALRGSSGAVDSTARSFERIQKALREAGEDGKRFADVDLSKPELRDIAADLTKIDTQFQDFRRNGLGRGANSLRTMASAPGGPQDFLEYDRQLGRFLPNAEDRGRNRGFVGSAIFRGTSFAPPPAPPSPVAAGGSAGGGGSNNRGLLSSVMDAIPGPVRWALGAAGVAGAGKIAATAVDQAQDEAISNDRLGKMLRDTGTDFDHLRQAVRQTADGMGITYQQTQQLSASWVALTNQTKSAAVEDAVRFSAGLARGYGIAPETTTQALGKATFAGEDPRRFAAILAETVRDGGLNGQVAETLSALRSWTETATKQMSSQVDTRSFAEMLAALSSEGKPGVKGEAGAAVLQQANDAIKKGGGFGLASQFLTYQAIVDAGGSKDPYEQRYLLEGGMFERVRQTPEGKPDQNSPTLFEATDNALRRQYENRSYKARLSAGANHFLMSTRQFEALEQARDKLGEGNFGRLGEMLGRADTSIEAVNPTAISQLTDLATMDHSGLEAKRRDVLERGDVPSPLHYDVRDAKGDDDLRVALTKAIASAGMEKTPGVAAQDAQASLSNSLTQMGTGLLPVVTLLKDAVADLAKVVGALSTAVTARHDPISALAADVGHDWGIDGVIPWMTGTDVLPGAGNDGQPSTARMSPSRRAAAEGAEVAASTEADMIPAFALPPPAAAPTAAAPAAAPVSGHPSTVSGRVAPVPAVVAPAVTPVPLVKAAPAPEVANPLSAVDLAGVPPAAPVIAAPPEVAPPTALPAPLSAHPHPDLPTPPATAEPIPHTLAEHGPLPTVPGEPAPEHPPREPPTVSIPERPDMPPELPVQEPPASVPRMERPGLPEGMEQAPELAGIGEHPEPLPLAPIHPSDLPDLLVPDEPGLPRRPEALPRLPAEPAPRPIARTEPAPLAARPEPTPMTGTAPPPGRAVAPSVVRPRVSTFQSRLDAPGAEDPALFAPAHPFAAPAPAAGNVPLAYQRPVGGAAPSPPPSFVTTAVPPAPAPKPTEILHDPMQAAPRPPVSLALPAEGVSPEAPPVSLAPTMAPAATAVRPAPALAPVSATRFRTGDKPPENVRGAAPAVSPTGPEPPAERVSPEATSPPVSLAPDPTPVPLRAPSIAQAARELPADTLDGGLAYGLGRIAKAPSGAGAPAQSPAQSPAQAPAQAPGATPGGSPPRLQFRSWDAQPAHMPRPAGGQAAPQIAHAPGPGSVPAAAAVFAPGAGLRSPGADQLGAISGRFESAGQPDAIGQDSKGGYSYGTFQLATKPGTLGNFLTWLERSHPESAAALTAAGGEAAATRGDPAFQTAWKKLAADDQTFAAAQHQYIEDTHYQPVADAAGKAGLDLASRSPELREAVFSTAVQHGAGGGAEVVREALASLGKDATSADDAKLIHAIYAERGQHFGSSTPQIQASVQRRMVDEEAVVQQNLTARRVREAGDLTSMSTRTPVMMAAAGAGATAQYGGSSGSEGVAAPPIARGRFDRNAGIADPTLARLSSDERPPPPPHTDTALADSPRLASAAEAVAAPAPSARSLPTPPPGPTTPSLAPPGATVNHSVAPGQQGVSTVGGGARLPDSEREKLMTSRVDVSAAAQVQIAPLHVVHKTEAGEVKMEEHLPVTQVGAPRAWGVAS